MAWFDDGGNKPPFEPTLEQARAFFRNPPRCAHCGQPVATVAANHDGTSYYHGACYRLEYPPEHPDESMHGIGHSSHDERVDDGLEYP